MTDRTTEILKTRIDTIVTWMRDPANAEVRGYFCLVTRQGMWVVDRTAAEFKPKDSDIGLSMISAEDFADVVVRKDHNFSNKLARDTNKNLPEKYHVQAMRVGDAMNLAAKTYDKQLKEKESGRTS